MRSFLPHSVNTRFLNTCGSYLSALTDLPFLKGEITISCAWTNLNCTNCFTPMHTDQSCMCTHKKYMHCSCTAEDIYGKYTINLHILHLEISWSLTLRHEVYLVHCPTKIGVFPKMEPTNSQGRLEFCWSQMAISMKYLEIGEFIPLCSKTMKMTDSNRQPVIWLNQRYWVESRELHYP